MPQRAKTPPPPQDEVFMTVHYPYPQHANMEIQEDVERVARWLGSIVKPAFFNAFYHKPSARNTVIIEVSKTIGDDKRKLLGQHTWKDILINPSDGEKGHRSGIFYCVYTNLRDVQKEGWKRIDFEDTWFMPRDGRPYTSIYYDQAEWEGIVEEDRVFRVPYPLSKRCEVPMEDPTNRGFCRPLPVSLFPIPVLPEMPREVPGTLKWTKVKAIPESEWAKMSPKALRGKSGSQKNTQTKDQRGRTSVPRNGHVGPPVAPVNSGVDHKSPGSLPPGLVINDKGKGKQKETGEPSPTMDELAARALAMELEDEDRDYQEYYGAGMENAAGSAISPTLPPLDRDPIDHKSVGVHVSGVTVKPVVVEDSLWGDPLEKINKKRRKEDDPPLCDVHGIVCSRGICKVYEKQHREYLKKYPKDPPEQGPQNWRDGKGGQNNLRGGTRGRGGTSRRGMLLRGSPLPNREFVARPSADENRAPRRPNGVPPPRDTRSKPNDDPKVKNAWGTNSNAWGGSNDAWSPSEKGESGKPVEKSDPHSNVNDDKGEMDCLWNPPAAQDWSQSDLASGSQAGPWSKPGKAGGKPNGRKNGAGGPRKPSPPRPTWSGTGEGAKEWTPSELGVGDSVSQRGDDVFRTAPTRNPEKKSWADQVEDEYANGDMPAPMVAREPDVKGGDEDDDEGWVKSAKGNGKGKGKAKSATGWSDVSNQGFW